MPELNQERVDQIVTDLSRVREIRLDNLPDHGSLIEVIADAMNALQVAYIMLAHAASHTAPQTPQGATFVSVSEPNSPKKL